MKPLVNSIVRIKNGDRMINGRIARVITMEDDFIIATTRNTNHTLYHDEYSLLIL